MEVNVPHSWTLSSESRGGIAARGKWANKRAQKRSRPKAEIRRSRFGVTRRALQRRLQKSERINRFGTLASPAYSCQVLNSMNVIVEQSGDLGPNGGLESDLGRERRKKWKFVTNL